MKICTGCKKEKSITEFSLNGSYRRNKCKTCSRKQINAWYEDNREVHLENTKKWASDNKDSRKKSYKTYREKNLDLCRKRCSVWQKNNPESASFHTSKRRSAKLNATPAWADQEQIKRIYLTCAKISKRTGLQHHVDHIIPLQGENVCGLHVETNLAIIPAKMNLQKSNMY